MKTFYDLVNDDQELVKWFKHYLVHRMNHCAMELAKGVSLFGNVEVMEEAIVWEDSPYRKHFGIITFRAMYTVVHQCHFTTWEDVLDLDYNLKMICLNQVIKQIVHEGASEEHFLAFFEIYNIEMFRKHENN